MLVLGIDIGTSSARCALFDEKGTRIDGTLAQQAYALHTDSDGKAELDPVSLLNAVRICLERTLNAQLKDRSIAAKPIAAVGASCFWHSLVGTTVDGQPLTSILTWADSRCRGDAEELRKKLSERQIHARTGCMLHSSFWPAKLRWFARTHADQFRECRYWMSPIDWLFLFFCETTPAASRCAHGMASASGLYDQNGRAYDAAMLKQCRLPRERLLPISNEPLTTAYELARHFPTLKTARWFPAIGDGAANSLGVGAVKPGLAAINFGTSAAVRIMRPAPAKAPFGLFRYAVDERRCVIGGAVSNAGNVRAWCLNHLQLPEPAELERILARRPGPTANLRALPFFHSERAPTWRDDLSGVIAGISHATNAIDLYQALTEGTYQRLASIVESIPGPRPTFIVGGGIQQSPSSLQRLADVVGAPLVASDEAETSLRGAALYALDRLGRAPTDKLKGVRVQPRKPLVKMYAEQRRGLSKLEKAVFG
jgi:gluconokinase